MELVVSTALVVGAALWLAHKIKLPNDFAVHIHLHTPERHITVGAQVPDEGLPVLPYELMEFIAGESEPWAREELLMKAHRLYGAVKTWDAVLTQLRADLGVKDKS
jgi:hypothetical protein